MPDATPRLDDYVLLGRSGLRVSRLCLGTMTFGTEWGWGSAESAAREMFDRYLDAGGNFIDTADGYTGGTSETLLGKFIRDRGNRDRVVLATKFTFGAEPGNPNAGGNGRKNIQRALEGSLRRLQTDCIDLYWMHAWDGLTPGALQQSKNPGFLKLFTDRNWQIVDALVSVAKGVGRSPAQVALNWVARRPAVASTIIGATKPSQLDDNLAALSFELPEPLRLRLDEVTRPETVHPYHFFEPEMQQMMTGGTRVSIR